MTKRIILEELSPKISGKIIKRFNEISIQVCEGQQYDMNYEEEDSIGEENYLEMIRLKTAVLRESKKIKGKDRLKYNLASSFQKTIN